jgi:hypothetical protein
VSIFSVGCRELSITPLQLAVLSVVKGAGGIEQREVSRPGAWIVLRPREW